MGRVHFNREAVDGAPDASDDEVEDTVEDGNTQLCVGGPDKEHHDARQKQLCR